MGAVVVTVGGVFAIANQRAGFTCDDDAIEDVRAAVASVPAYEYTATGQYRAFNGIYPVNLDGEFERPNKVRERHLDQAGSFSIQTPFGGEWLRIGERLWVREPSPTGDLLPWEVVSGDAFGAIGGFPAFVYRSVPENPALFALDGLVEPAAALQWTAVTSGPESIECILTGTRRYSQNGALMSVTTWVDPGTALPQRLVLELTGWTLGDVPRDRRLEYRFHPEEASSISPPPADQVQPEPSPLEITPQPEMTIKGTGEITLADERGDYLRLHILEVTASPEFPTSTALPGYTFLSVRVGYEPLRSLGPEHASGVADWAFSVDDLPLSASPPWVPGGPEPRLQSHVGISPPDALEGWMSIEAPLDGDIVMSFKAENGAEPKLHVILRED